MIEREGKIGADVIVPPSIDRLFSILQRSITVDQKGLDVESSVSPQEFEWTAQEILQECTQLESEQVAALARAIAQEAHISPNYLGASVRRVGDYLSGLAQLLAVHPATILGGAEREEVLGDAHWYHKTVTNAYEIMQPKYNASEANAHFVRRVVGAVAIHLEQLEIPHFLQEEDVADTACTLQIGVIALRGAQYISRGEYRRLTTQILAARAVAQNAKPADVLFIPPDWQNNL